MSRLKILLRLVLGLMMVSMPELANGQGGHIWYFGGNAGVDFNTNPPTPLYDGALSTSEGCASLTDQQGNLLMYTDGVFVYNRLHQQMPNGFGLLGHSSSTQSAVIVPQPGNDSVFYIFTTPKAFEGNFCFSKVNISLQNGLGDVTLKNEVLHSLASEQLSAVQHPNGIDYWVVARQKNTNNFLAYEITSAGVNYNAVVSSVGPAIDGYIGQLKFSPDGTRVAQVKYGNPTVILCDFNGSTGVISNSLLLDTQLGYGYGLEFSPNGKYLYASNFTR